jgi:hypothetical protein
VRQRPQLLHRPRQIADDERIRLMSLPPRLALLHAADIAQPFGHHPAGGGRNVDADPLSAKVLRRDQSGTAAAEGIEDDVVRVAAH